jgi:hypothetical protein
MNETLPKYELPTAADVDYPEQNQTLPAVTLNRDAKAETAEPRFEGNAVPSNGHLDAAREVDATDSERQASLFVKSELESFRTRWDEVQTSFVDEPRKAVQDADGLVANMVSRIAEQFSREREQLESQWERGSDVSTEDLRQAFKRYRAFFGRLLAV